MKLARSLGQLGRVRKAYQHVPSTYSPRIPARTYHASQVYRTDGVYKELTEMRVRTPWIEALRRSKESGNQSTLTPADPPQPDLTPKRMSDSFVRIILPLSQDPWMLDTYANFAGQIRIGTLLMDLDALAGVVAYKHTGEGVSTVTAAIDRITVQNPLKEICDLELSGQVTYATGRSSMEITLQIAKAPTPDDPTDSSDVFMTCAFTMVALDPLMKKSITIAPLKVVTQSEKALFARGEANYKAKKSVKEAHILNSPPNAEESKLIHKMWTATASQSTTQHPPVTDPAAAPHPTHTPVPISRTTIHSTQIMQPQYRNRHSFKIFGGFLLKTTFELAFTCAASFSHTRPRFLSLDPSTFEQPVPVGSVLYVSANVTYTAPATSTSSTDPTTHPGTRIQVMVRTHVRPVEHSSSERTNTGTFFYTFHSPADVSVLPQSYGEFMMWVSGRRRAQRLEEAERASGGPGRMREEEVLGIDGNHVTE